MSVAEIIRKLRENNIDLSVDDGKLRIRGNKVALSDSQLLDLVREHKQELIDEIARGAHLTGTGGRVAVPANMIPSGCTAITPSMLPLVNLNQEEIDRIIAGVPGGAANVQDIYPLAPLQEGILFHHLLETEGDVYLTSRQFAVTDRELLNRYAQAVQAVIDRHDIMRTAVMWEDLTEPVQVVWRRANLSVEEIALNPAEGDIAEQLRSRFDARRYRIDVRQAPMRRLFITHDAPNARWVALELVHHLVDDNTSMQLWLDEIEAHLSGRAQHLPAPAPFRTFVAQARLGVSREEHERFFSAMLADVDEPTVPYGLTNAQGDGSRIVEAHLQVEPDLCHRLRTRARALGVSVASVCHLAWARVLSAVSGREDVVFGTLLLGRMQGGDGADRALGLFINTLPLRIHVGEQSVQSSVLKTHELLTQLVRHEHAPLALAQRCSAVPAPAPLFTAMLNYRHGSADIQHAGSSSSGGWSGFSVLTEQERTNYPFGLAVNDLGERLSFDAQVDSSIDAQQVCMLMYTALESLVAALERAPATPIGRIPTLSAELRRSLVALGNGGPAIESLPGHGSGCLYELVAAQVLRRPDAIAIVAHGVQMTYREIFQHANGVAHELQRLGAAAESRIGILADQSAEALIGTLGILAAGAAYVPLDPAAPPERIGFVLANAEVLALVAPAALRELARTLAQHRCGLDDKVVVVNEVQHSESPPHAKVDPDDAAYVIYTSGTTGTPKGVVVNHRSVMNLVLGFIARHDFAGQRLLMIPPLIFDASVGDLFPILAAGGSLVLHPAPGELDAAELQRFCCEHRVTGIDAPAALWRRWTEGFAALDDSGPVLPEIKFLMFGGEGVSVEQVRAFARLTGGRITLSNHYGPTEATVCATMLTTRDGSELSGTDLPIGRPLPGVQVYILDRNLQLVPRGVAGELFIGGAGVARGYIGEAALNAERFLRDPHSADPQARLYRTGDLVRWNADGTLQFLGRNDQQVKIRGFRIELGEIEARLAEHVSVGEAVVVARGGAGSDKQLVAYVTAGNGAGLDIADLRNHLGGVLPQYMVPAAYVVMERLPLTPNGKLDRKALPVPQSEAYVTAAYEAPVGEVESTLARIWSEVLKLERVGRHDNFFELGGNSLLAATQLTRLRQALGAQVKLKDLFVHPVLRSFAEVVKGSAGSAQSPLTAVPRDQPLALSFAQQRLWFLAQIAGASEAYHIPTAVRIGGALNVSALKQALDRIVVRHEVLRTSFRKVGDQPEQHIARTAGGFALREQDLRAAADLPAQIEQLFTQEAGQPFDLEHGPLIRGQLLRVAQNEHLLLITMHHIVSDAWSMGVFFNELHHLYQVYRQGQPDPLPALPIQYADYAVWQRQWLSGEVLERHADYWRRMLTGAPTVLTLPTDMVRPAEQSFAGAETALQLDERLTRGLKALSQRHGLTLYMTMLAAWAVVLSRLSGQDDVVIGTPVANRTRPEIEPLIGFFVNTLALRLSVGGSIAGFLQHVKGRVLDAQEHQELPFEHVVEIVKPPRSLSHSPIFQVMLAWQNADAGSPSLPGLELSAVEVAYKAAKFDLELNLSEAGGRIVGGLGYASALFQPDTIERHVGYLRRVVTAMVEDDQQQVDRIALLGAAERHQVLLDWNATEGIYPQDHCIHELFEAQVKCVPDAVAVLYEGRTLTYAQLNRQANRLAHYLRRQGVEPDTRVAICAERGPEMVVGLLAILKAGGGYVPLDPVYPPERLSQTLIDSAPVALLTYLSAQLRATLSGLLGCAAMPVLDLQHDATAWASEPDEDPATAGLSPRHLAYVIYTSGSTGVPKGVMIEHANVARLFSATQHWFGFDHNDVWTLFHSYAFDFSVWEIWGALLHGGRLVIVPHEVTRSPQEFYRLLCTHGVTVLNQTPSAFRQLIAAQGEDAGGHHLRCVIFGGEALEVSTLQPWYRRECNRATRLINMYGITETTVHVTYRPLVPADAHLAGPSPIGGRIPDLKIYILDAHGEPAPIGVAGELYVGGAGVARGYLNRPELTAQRFLKDRFGDDPHARMYRTGDLGRYLPDGSIEYLGRNDHQVKIRGFRIELGEIEARLAEHESIAEAAVLAREDAGGDKRLVAYITPRGGAVIDIAGLRGHLGTTLPQYMVPAAYVILERLPLTPNGKLDRKALPAPQGEAYAKSAYEAPVGEVEGTLARIWREVLKLERVGRHDNFFELGGHSLLAVTLIERMRQADLKADVRTIFAAPTLATLGAAIGAGSRTLDIPPNLITAHSTAITPAMVPLVRLSQEEIDLIVAQVPGGATNIQDIYPLAPLQEGILFHHLLETQGDVYLTSRQFAAADREQVMRYARALQAVIDRHDILRTAVMWEGLSEPVQVVWRHARLVVEELRLDPNDGDIAQQMRSRCDARHYRLDVRQAPMWRLFIAHDAPNGRWIALEVVHHLVDDNTSLRFLLGEIEAHMSGRTGHFAAPAPFRNFVAQARLGVSREEHERFFKEMLGDVDEPTAPFGLADVRGNGSGIVEAHRDLDPQLCDRLRASARAAGVTVASLCHLAVATVLAAVSGREDVVFGTVMFGRMQGIAGADRALGMFINTLPLRITIGEEGVLASLRRTHRSLTELLRHEHAPLTLAQSCSAVRSPAPLFTAMLNYRHGDDDSPDDAEAAPEVEDWAGMELLWGEERTNYPLTFSIDDFRGKLSLDAKVDRSIEPSRVCSMLQRALESMVTALEQSPATPIHMIEILPAAERRQVVVDWNTTQAQYPHEWCVHELFEMQAQRSADAVAVVFEDGALTYAELNRRANQLAHELREHGVRPDTRVAICLDRGLEMVVSLLAVLKSGGAYVPLDPSYPVERLEYMLGDAGARVLLTHSGLRDALPKSIAPEPGKPVVPLQDALTLIALDEEAERIAGHDGTNRAPDALGLTPSHLAYVIYTSGSTGQPKGVMVEHRNLTNFLCSMQQRPGIDARDRLLAVTTLSFDIAGLEVYLPLIAGARIVIASREQAQHGQRLAELIRQEGVTILQATPATWRLLLEAAEFDAPGLKALCGGEALGKDLAARLSSRVGELWNVYGPTETTIWSTARKVSAGAPGAQACEAIGGPIANTQVYILDQHRKPVPIGVSGEIYIGGAGVTRGYLNRPELTQERFIADPFNLNGQARLYRTGDLGRWLEDGSIDYLGRNDHQVKIRGFRIELGEIEAQLASYATVGEAAVVAREEGGDKRLVAYVTPRGGAAVDLVELRTQLSAVLPQYMVPAAYVVLERMPLTPNGKLDRKALPAPQGDTSAASAYEAPVGEFESTLARIWGAVLKLERVGRHDNFFDLGGHSLLVVKVVNQLGQAGIRTSIADVFNYPTVSSLAGSRLETAAHATRTRGAVRVRGGSQQPLFLVHDGYGDEVYFSVLAQHLPAQLPVYGLPSVALAGQRATVQALARQMIKVIQDVQPTGPYCLAGWSFGGVVAYEMAQQLLQQGRLVDFLGLIDSLCPEHGNERATVKSPLEVLVELCEEQSGAAGLELHDIATSGVNFDALFERYRALDALPESLQYLSAQEARTRCEYFAVHTWASDAYRARPIGTPVHLYVATQRPPAWPTTITASLGWERHASGNLRQYAVPGSHVSMMRPPHIARLGELLGRSVMAAQRALRHAVPDDLEPPSA